jgi:hypothetical protein
MSNLKSQLEKLEPECLAFNNRELRHARECLLEALQTYNHSRYHLGRTLRAYQSHFKARHQWVAVAKVVAAAMGRSDRTVFRILEDYERAAQLPPIMLEAMLDQKIDPAAGKNVAVVENLLQMPEPDTAEEAASVVAEAVRKQVAQRRKKASPCQAKPGVEAFAKHVVKQFQDRYRSVDRSERHAEVQYVLELVVNTLRIEVRELRHFARPALVPKPVRNKAA